LEKYQQLEQRVQEAEKQAVSSATPYTAIPEPEGLKAIESPQRPKPRLPDLPYFEGDKAEWRDWKLEMENKLSKDSQILGNELSQFRYVYSRLKRKAKKQVTTFVEVGVGNRAGTTKEFLYRFDLLYG
jgi:hypothetical protein